MPPHVPAALRKLTYFVYCEDCGIGNKERIDNQQPAAATINSNSDFCDFLLSSGHLAGPWLTIIQKYIRMSGAQMNRGRTNLLLKISATRTKTFAVKEEGFF